MVLHHPPRSVRGIYSKSRSCNCNIATSSDRQVPFGGLRHCCKPHRRRILRRFFSKAASLLHSRPHKSSTSGTYSQTQSLKLRNDTHSLGKGDKDPAGASGILA